MAEEGVVPSAVRSRKMPIFVFFKDSSLVFKMDSLGREILAIAIPAAMALAADPIASLIDTAFIGHIGAVEIGAVGIAINLFNQISKVAVYPLVSITTSFVAEEETVGRITNESTKGEILEKSSAKLDDAEKSSVDDHKLDNMEKGSAVDNEIKDLTPNNDSKTVACKSPSAISNISHKSNFKGGKRHIPSASTALIFG